MPRVLILGSGGREHCLGWTLARDPRVTEVWFSPGNGGTHREEKSRNVPFSPDNTKDWPKIADLIEEVGFDLILVGPENPLALGLRDFLEGRGVERVFAPTSAATKIESDKFFSFRIMEELKIPQAEGIPCYTESQLLDAIEYFGERGVAIKARGLAKGKGVTVCSSSEEAKRLLPQILKKYGPELLISEKLEGEEFSVFALCEGERFALIPIAARDYKRLLDGDRGPNTGGMGAYAPHPEVSPELLKWISENIFSPLLSSLSERQTPFRGTLYAGLIKTASSIKVLEFNARFGDPETQVVLPLISTPLLDILDRLLDSSAPQVPQIDVKGGAAVCVAVVSPGYPESPKKGIPLPSSIFELEKKVAKDFPAEFKIFHAATRVQGEQIISDGGRIFYVTAIQDKLQTARSSAYRLLKELNLPNQLYYRKDIAAQF